MMISSGSVRLNKRSFMSRTIRLCFMCVYGKQSFAVTQEEYSKLRAILQNTNSFNIDSMCQECATIYATWRESRPTLPEMDAYEFKQHRIHHALGWTE